MSSDSRGTVSAIVLIIISLCLVRDVHTQASEQGEAAFPTITILDTIALKSPIVRLHATPPGFAVLESNGDFTSFDSTGRAVNTISLSEIEKGDDFILIPGTRWLVVIRHREVGSRALNWLTAKLLPRSEPEYISSVVMVDIFGADDPPVYEFRGWVSSADVDLESGNCAVLIGNYSKKELNVFNIESGTPRYIVEVSRDAHNVIISSEEVFVLEPYKVLVYSFLGEEGLAKEREHQLTEAALSSRCFTTFETGSKSLACLTDSLAVTFGPITLLSGGILYPQMEDFWWKFVGGRYIYHHDLLVPTSELFMVGEDELAIANLNSATFEVYPTQRVTGFRERMRIIPLTASKCVIQLFDEDYESNMLVMADLER